MMLTWLKATDWRWHLVGISALDVVASYSNFQMFRCACERPRVTCKLARGDHRCLQMLVPLYLATNLQVQVRLLISGVPFRDLRFSLVSIS